MSETPLLTKPQKIQLLQAARQAIFNHIHRGRRFVAEADDSRLQKKQGVFITLTTRGIDRGCIGTFDGDGPLLDTVVDVAIRAASEESGFPRLAVQDLPHTDIELSVVSPVNRLFTTFHQMFINR